MNSGQKRRLDSVQHQTVQLGVILSRLWAANKSDFSLKAVFHLAMKVGPQAKVTVATSISAEVLVERLLG